MSETEYQRAWRERGEAERAMRQYRNSQSPTFIKVTGTMAGIAGFFIVGAFIQDPDWGLAPVLILATMFIALPLLGPSVIRDQERQRAEAEKTLKRLGVWK